MTDDGAEKAPTRVLRVALPDQVAEFVLERVADGGYGSPGEYIRDLIRADQKRHAKSQLETVLLSVAKSGDPSELTPEMLEEIGQRMRGRVSNRS